jgi:hypothetical protein
MPARFAAPIGPLHSGRLGSAVLAEARRMPPETPDGSVEAGFAGCPPPMFGWLARMINRGCLPYD